MTDHILREHDYQHHGLCRNSECDGTQCWRATLAELGKLARVEVGEMYQLLGEFAARIEELERKRVSDYWGAPPVDMHEEGVRVMKETMREKDIRIAAQLVQIDGLRERVERWERVVDAAGLKLVPTAEDWMLVRKP